MAAYAALVSVMYTIEQIEHHPRPPISLDKTQVESLTEKLTFLQEFLEGYSHVGYSREADPLEMRMRDAAYAAEDVIESHIVDQILAGSTSHDGEKISSNIDSHILPRSRSRDEKISFLKFFKCFRGPRKSATDHDDEASSTDQFYQSLQKVIEDMDSIKKEVMDIKEKTGVRDQLLRNSMPSGSLRSFSTGQNMTMVGFDDVLVKIMDKLTGGQLDRQIIPIFGMGGIGKTTLARNIYQNQVVVQHFDILVWVNISQQYKIKEILSELLQGGGNLSQMNEYELGDELHKRLSSRRYLIIMDDIWDIEVWDQLRRFFPDSKNGSRIVITTRISNFKLTDSFVLKMGFLDKDKSWSMFSKIVFGEEGFPLELEEIGKKIVENCRGLPLSIVVVGGLLAKSEHTREYWEYIAENLNSIVNSKDDENCLKILHLSYSQLPIYLKPCFLYMGVFSEDRNIRVSKLVKLWAAEGFLKPVSCKSLEEIAGEYLKELINRNLVLVYELGCTGNIKYCKIHDLLRDLCLRQAEKERFFNVIRQLSLNVPRDTCTQRRIVIPDSTSPEEVLNVLQFMSLARSLICDSWGDLPLHNFRFLRIMSNSQCTYSPNDMLQLVNSRCIVLNFLGDKIPSSVRLLWNLHTLIVHAGNFTSPFEIWNMPQLRHLELEGLYLPDPPRGKVGGRDDIVLRNLHTLGRIKNFKCCKEVVKRIPNIKKLRVCYYGKFKEGYLNNLGHLHKLESFYCLSHGPASDNLQNLTFPHSLKKLNLETEYVHWEDMMEKIGSLPLLEKLTLKHGSFEGGKWETVEGRFPSLKFLSIEQSDLKYWTTESSHFPRLEHLVLVFLEDLMEIPSEIGEIPTLKSLKLVYCRDSAAISARKIKEEQEELYGEVALQVRVVSELQLRIASTASITESLHELCSNFDSESARYVEEGGYRKMLQPHSPIITAELETNMYDRIRCFVLVCSHTWITLCIVMYHNFKSKRNWIS